MNDIRDILGIGDDEGDAGFHFRDPDELTPEQRQKLMAVGLRAAMALVERGNESFSDYASMMIKALGNKVRPWLKAFYGGLEYIPGYDKYSLTPYDEVKAFDVENFDKPHNDVLAKASMRAEEGKAQTVANKATDELKEKRNERRKETDEQRAADTAAIAKKAGTAASEVEAVAETSENEQSTRESAERVDDALDDVDGQLSALGYFEGDGNDQASAEKKAVSKAAELAESLISDLGIDRYAATHEESLHGGINKKKPIAVADIGDKYGFIMVRLPLADGRTLVIEMSAERVSADSSVNGNPSMRTNSLTVSVMRKSDSFGETCENRESVLDNGSYKGLLETIQRMAYKYLDYPGAKVDGVYHSGDKVQYSSNGGRTWSDAVVVNPDDNGMVLLDTGLAPVMYVSAEHDQLKHKAKETNDVDKAVAEAKAAMKAKLEQIKDKLDKDLLNEQIAQREKYMLELADRVKAGETIGTFAGVKNVDLQASLLRCIGERDALKEALEHLPAKPSAESIADNPQSWVGKTFIYGNTRLVCKEVEGNYATFDNPDTFMNVGFEVDKVQKGIKSGKWSVEGAIPASAHKDENIFQKAERIAKKDKAKRDKAKAATDVDASNSVVPAKESNPKAKKVKPEQKVGEMFDDSMNESEKAENGEKADANSEIHRKFANAVKDDMLASLSSGEKPYRGIVDLRKRARELGMEVDDDGRTDILLQELVEDGLVRAAREVIEQGKSNGRYSSDTYQKICKLYEMQPTITARSSNRIKMQQYSTPLPMAFNAARFAMRGKLNGAVFEPTAGNGMLVFSIPSEQVHVNELDGTRLANLREQGFAEVTQQDATQPFEGGKKYDVVICNPPFGKSEPVDYDGKMIGGLDPQITLNALEHMKDDGRAAIIIGGNMEYAANGGIKSMKSFFTYLYDHYNVKGVVDMDGKLYAKQGTTFPTRMILIDGRRSEEDRAQSAVYPPVKSKAVRKAESFEDLFNIVDELTKSKEKTNGTEVLRSQEGEPVSVTDKSPGKTDGGRHRGEPHKDDEAGRRGKRGGNTEPKDTVAGGGQVLLGQHRQTVGDGASGNRTEGDTGRRSGGVQPAIHRVGDVGLPSAGVGLTPAIHAEPKKRDLTDENSAYRPHSTAFSLKSVAPAAMVEAMDNVLSRIEKEYGNIDDFVTKELGYDSVEDAHHALAAEQMDSVAMAIYQMKHGQALIIGDQTGVGKGRQMAALIRWAVRQGKKPVFFTKSADLFTDIYRDLLDVGSGDLKPFIINDGETMVDSEGNVVYKAPSKKEQSKVFASGKLPDEYDFAILTYSQVNTGDEISKHEFKAAAKASGSWTKKSKGPGRPTPKATFIRTIAKDNYLLLDESHTASGLSNAGVFLQSILRSAKAATFASATFAKRPDSMPIYAIRTAMSQAGIKANEMIGLIAKGGVTLQEIMSRELTNAGQMVRRERDMSDVRTDWKTIDDAETVRKARENYDKTIEAFNAIIRFQKNYVRPVLAKLSFEYATRAMSADMRRGTKNMGIDNTPFASKTYNYTKQLMLALKVDAVVDEVEKEIKAGKHPVIALESTMEGLLKEYEVGETIEDATLGASLQRGLDGVMKYTVTDENGQKFAEQLTPSELGKAGEAAYSCKG